jgi:RNA polymerase sigma-70 factor (ECF subfamily)
LSNLNEELIIGIRKGDLIAFEKLYLQYYAYLCLIAEHIVKNRCDAEEVVSDVFVKLWNIKEKIEIISVKAYLVRAVHNTSLNYLERSSIKNRSTETINDSEIKLLAWDSDYPLGHLYEKEVLDILDQGIGKLPDGCREIFMLSRIEEMKYQDIASKLGISVNTVKTQMKIALSRLRETLKDYLPVLMFFLAN